MPSRIGESAFAASPFFIILFGISVRPSAEGVSRGKGTRTSRRSSIGRH